MALEKQLIDDVSYEAASVCDVNDDGTLDIVCGEYWYEGPNFDARHQMCEVRREGEYYDDFADIPLDVNGDGRPDIVTGGWFGEALRWRENPGDEGKWPVHDIATVGNIETIRAFDIDGCGTVEVFPNTPGEPQSFFKLRTDSTRRPVGEFDRYVIGDKPSGHGLGFGDVNGDGRSDVILADGWLECPDDPLSEAWEFHQEFDFGRASVPILAHDVNGDGLTDLIVGQAHDYGLSWWEQDVAADGTRMWEEHVIDDANSQYHDLRLVDVDRDGELELVTGKRYRAHCGDDPGADDPLGVYYFDVGEEFERHVLDRGPPSEATGCGIYFWVADVSGNGRPDLVMPGKNGLYLLENYED